MLMSGAEETPALTPVVSFWHGEMSWLEQLCLTSFVRHGHKVRVFAYERPTGLPEGVYWEDAARILPQDQMFFYKKNGTPAVFSDLFRLELMRREEGLWVDCDIYCYRPFTDLGAFVFGWEVPPGADGKGGSINNAVLRCPSDSLLLKDLIDVFKPENARASERFLPWHRRAEMFVRRLFGEKIAVFDMQFGATGPFPLTHYARRYGLIDEVKAPEVFYPVPYEKIPELMEPGSDIADFVTEKTLGVHVWRSQLTNRGRAGIAAPAPDSALAKLCAQEGITVSA